MNILDKIVVQKKLEIEIAKKLRPVEALQTTLAYKRKTYSLAEKFTGGNKGIIAEFKRQSPSKGVIKLNADVEEITGQYQQAGVFCVSVLTDALFFGAQENDFSKARKILNIPMLRKDFIIDPYQVHETKAMGADVLLLIASILSSEEIKMLTELSHETGLEVLLELHGETELEKLYEKVDFIGINNRDLKSFEVDTALSASMAKSLPASIPKIAESGIKDIETMRELVQAGFSGFLIGESFMKTTDPGYSSSQFVQALNA